MHKVNNARRNNSLLTAGMKDYYFTLASNQGGPGCVAVHAKDSEEAREIMFSVYGQKWAFQYDYLEDVHPNDRKLIIRIKPPRKENTNDQ